ncbi:sugar phosphate nucleotidyltransferase, partial [Oleiphilus sp. HI0117]
MNQRPDIRALLLSAGLGTRLRPLTNNWPKCLMPINGRPLLEYWLQTLDDIGIHHAVV